MVHCSSALSPPPLSCAVHVSTYPNVIDGSLQNKINESHANSIIISVGTLGLLFESNMPGVSFAHVEVPIHIIR